MINILQGRKLVEMYHFPHFIGKDIIYRRKVKELYCLENLNHLHRLANRKTGFEPRQLAYESTIINFKPHCLP